MSCLFLILFLNLGYLSFNRQRIVIDEQADVDDLLKKINNLLGRYLFIISDVKLTVI